MAITIKAMYEYGGFSGRLCAPFPFFVDTAAPPSLPSSSVDVDVSDPLMDALVPVLSRFCDSSSATSSILLVLLSSVGVFGIVWESEFGGLCCLCECSDNADSILDGSWLRW